MREIEIKAKVSDLSALIAKIEAMGLVASEPIVQRDQVFTRGDAVGANGSVFLRIREETVAGRTKSSFTLKKMVDGHGDKIECETEIANASEMLRAIKEMDFVPYVIVEKTRRTVHADSYEICLDTVSGLGDFVEFEKIAPENADHNAIVDELWSVAGQFGLDRRDAVDKGYDVLLKRD